MRLLGGTPSPDERGGTYGAFPLFTPAEDMGVGNVLVVVIPGAVGVVTSASPPDEQGMAVSEARTISGDAGGGHIPVMR